MSTQAHNIQIDVLIVGQGPAGGSAGVFLSHLDPKLKVMMISKAGSIADTPRAHITNAMALECLRDIGLEDECVLVATKRDKMLCTRFTDTFLGTEWARLHSWGNDPEFKNQYEGHSPCVHSDLPQTLLEPILIKEASTRGTISRFNTEFLSFEQDAQGVTSHLRDNLTNTPYTVRSKFLIGSDGGRSPIVEQLKIPLQIEPAGSVAINVHFRCDMTPHMATRIGNLHHCWLIDTPAPDYATFGILRAVKTWTEWIMILFAKPGFKGRATDAQYVERTIELIGKERCPKVEVIGISTWIVRETVAKYYSEGRVFAAGDAVHRHPPFNGLGSNTSLQDSYNLSWKLNYVLKGWATEKLLASYSIERQPVGAGVIKRANDGLRDHLILQNALNMLDDPDDPVARRTKIQSAFKELLEDSDRGEERRKAFQSALENCRREFTAIGQEMNQRYQSDAVYTKDESNPLAPLKDEVYIHEPSTYPGCRLPHAWLTPTLPDTPRISTLDLAGHGSFCLLTGIRGSHWLQAAENAKARLSGLPLNVYMIGYGQPYYDTYGDWRKKSNVGESGCVLVRPDRFVAWRCKEGLGSVEKCSETLELVLGQILGRDA